MGTVRAAMVLGLALLAPRVATAADTPRAPFTARALLIGVEEFKPGRDFGKLTPMVANDLLAMRRALLGAGYDAANIDIVTNARALDNSEDETVHYREELSKPEILLAVQELSQQDGEDQVVLLYVAGHGGTHRSQRYLAAWDSVPGDGRTFASLYEIAEDFAEAVPQSNKLLITDACSDETLSKGVAEALEERFGIDVLFSSQLTQSSHAFADLEFAEFRGMSLFTWSLVSVLNDRTTFGGDLEVKSGELLESTSRKLTEYWRSKGANQPCPVPEKPSQPFGGTGATSPSNSPFDSNAFPRQCPRRLTLSGRDFAVGHRQP